MKLSFVSLSQFFVNFFRRPAVFIFQFCEDFGISIDFEAWASSVGRTTDPENEGIPTHAPVTPVHILISTHP